MRISEQAQCLRHHLMGDELRIDGLDPRHGDLADGNVSDAMVRLTEDLLVPIGKESPQRHLVSLAFRRWMFGHRSQDEARSRIADRPGVGRGVTDNSELSRHSDSATGNTVPNDDESCENAFYIFYAVLSGWFWRDQWRVDF